MSSVHMNAYLSARVVQCTVCAAILGMLGGHPSFPCTMRDSDKLRSDVLAPGFLTSPSYVLAKFLQLHQDLQDLEI